jgi:hypothetical protein
VVPYQKNLGDHPYFDIFYQYMGKSGQVLGKLPHHPKGKRQGKPPAWKHPSPSPSKPVAVATWVGRLPRYTLCLALNLPNHLLGRMPPCSAEIEAERVAAAVPPSGNSPAFGTPSAASSLARDHHHPPQTSVASIWPQLPRLAQPR